MKTLPLLRIFSGLCSVALVAVAFTSCEVRQTQDAKAPDVDVDVKASPGQLPKYDVETADVDVKTEDQKVLVPQVGLKEETIKVPDIDVNMPGETPAASPTATP